MEIRVAAPNRIDLAGGTTDLYPLYLFMEGGCTVNSAISVFSSVVLRSHSRKGIRITSLDLEKTIEANDPSDLPMDGPLALISRAVRAIPPKVGLEIITCNQAPAGSGLGASSALVVALISGLCKLNGVNKENKEIARLSMNLETACLGVPAGNQDHIAAIFGGVSILEFDHNNFERKTSADENLLQKIEQSIILSFTGKGRFSGMNNWEVTKRFIDGDLDVREKLLRIRDIARELGSSIVSGNGDQLGELIDAEWQVRKLLAEGITNSQIETIMLAASESGAIANKICGAGGGGCMISITDPAKRAQVESAIVDAGGRLVPFAIEREGVRIDCLS